MPINRNQRTYPLTLKSTTAYALNQGLVTAYDYAGNPNNAYAGGNGVPHVGTLVLAPEGSPTLVTLPNGILGRDPSQGLTVQTGYRGSSVGAMGFGAADGKGSWTIHRRFRAPSAYSGYSSYRNIADYRDKPGNQVRILMVESIANPWCFFTVEFGGTSNQSVPPVASREAAAYRVPYGSIVDLHIVRDGDVGKLYLNGVLASSITLPTTYNLYNSDWTGILRYDGSMNGTPSDLIQIDHNIWNRALSDAEVAQHKNDPYAGYVNTAVVPDGITIISPPPNSTVNSEGFTISGSYQGGSPTSIQARFNGGAWVTIVSSPSGGSFSGQLTNLTRGTGTLEVRYGNTTTVTSSVSNITASPPAPSISVTNQPPSGQSVTISATFQRASSLTYSLVANSSGAVGISETVSTTYSVTAATSSKTFTGVAPGEYTVNVVASGPVATTTATGTPFSILGVSGGGSVDTPVTSATQPSAPLGVSAIADDGNITVLFNPPASNGGSPITGYIVKASTGQAISVPASPAQFTLPKGVQVTFTVQAVNDIGPSVPSAPSNAVIPATLPGAPTGVVASIVNGVVTVAFSMPVDNGGYPITGSLVVASTGETAEGATSPITIDVPTGTSATFTVKVRNQLGYGPLSTPSNSLTPKATTATIKLVTHPSGSAVPGLSGLKWAWFDQSTPDNFLAPTDKGTSEVTDSSGNITVEIPNTKLQRGQIGWLIITNSNGNISTTSQVFSGPVEAS